MAVAVGETTILMGMTRVMMPLLGNDLKTLYTNV